MINALKPYLAYKNSGVPWLGEVPEHWDVRRLGSVTQILNGATPSSSRPEYWDGDIVWVTPDDLGKLKGRYIDNSSRRITQEGDNACGTTLAPAESIVLSTRAPIGHLGILRVAACANQGCRLLVPQAATASEFLYHMLVTARPSLEVLGQGSTFLELSRSKLGTFPIPFPPLPEQTAIVRFLDYMDRRIRRVIRTRQRRIKLLEEYKQAFIHQAVTGKIDVSTGEPYPAYKDSGVEWLGKVPEHWEVMRLKRIARLNPSKSEVPLESRNGNAIFLPMERVRSDGRFDASEIRPISDLWNGFTYFRRGDVIVAKITPCFENGKGACLENIPTAIGFGSTEFHVIRPSKVIVSAYLYRTTTLSEFRRLGTDEMTGAAGQQRVPVEFIANFLVPLPPLPEQTAIVEYLDTQTAKIDAAIAAARREIELLREYRERLIADVVTGKLDVREAAAQLPEESAEEEVEFAETDRTTEEEGADEAEEPGAEEETDG